MRIRRWETICLFAMLLAVSAVLLRTSRARPLWYDERFTQVLSQSPSFESLTHRLSSGADLNPPVHYLACRLTTTLFGDSRLSIRLPSLFGGLFAMLATFLVVRHRRSVAEAFLAACLLAVSEHLTHYFTEARPYGLMLGFTALSLLFWQRAGEHPLAAIGLGLSLMLGIATHYYFTVPILVFGLAELARVFERKQLNVPVLLAVMAPVIVLALMMPLWRGPQKAYTDGFWAKITLSPLEITNVYSSFSDNLVFTTLGIVFALALLGSRKTTSELTESYPFSERVAIAGLAVVPVIAFVLSALVTKVYVPRYCIPFAVGMAVTLAYAISEMARRHRGVLYLAGFLSVSVGLAVQWKWTHERAEKRHQLLKMAIDDINHLSNGRYVVIELATPDRIDFALSDFALAYRPIVMIDVARAKRFDGQDTVDRGTIALAALTNVDRISFEDVVEYLKIGFPIDYLGDENHWRAKELKALGVQFQKLHSLQGRTESVYRLEEKK